MLKPLSSSPPISVGGTGPRDIRTGNEHVARESIGGPRRLPDAKRLRELETENTRLKKLLAESILEIEVTREALRKKW
ncbi:hypothetical protein HDE77_002375 [Rhodanobacter sp. MP7CTX1]|nr:hypothetical protein [Rhodanobacter sp. MP7CTX1]